MPLQIDDLRPDRSDEEVLDAIIEELKRRSKEDTERTPESFVAWLETLPRGLRAMAATQALDVSLALDDLGWHFANHHDKGLCQATFKGLRELECDDAADTFQQACKLVMPHWDTITDLLTREGAFPEWYNDSALDEALLPLNKRMWELCKRPHALMGYWVEYARKYPDRLIG